MLMGNPDKGEAAITMSLSRMPQVQSDLADVSKSSLLYKSRPYC